VNILDGACIRHIRHFQAFFSDQSHQSSNHRYCIGNGHILIGSKGGNTFQNGPMFAYLKSIVRIYPITCNKEFKMIRKHWLFIIAGSCFAIVVVSFVFGTRTLADDMIQRRMPSVNDTSNSSSLLAPIPGGPGFISIGGFALKPTDSSGQYSTIGQALYNSGPAGAPYHAPIALPNRATITKVVLFYYDNDTTDDLQFGLTRLPLNEVGGPAIAYFISSGAEDTIRSVEITSISDPVVDQQQFAYLLQAYLPDGPNAQIVSVRIDYSYPSNLPLITK
jgi:hypothetical protein